MLKKLLAVLLVFALLFCLTACSDSKKGADKAPTDTKTEEKGIVGLWKSEAKIKVKDIMIATTDIEGVPQDSIALLNLFPQIESDAEIDVYIEFKEDNTYQIKYKLDDFKSGLKDYYKNVYAVFKDDRPLFEEVFNLDFVVIETMMINSTLNSYGEIVDSYEKKNANRIDELSDSVVLSYVAPALTGGDVKDGYVIVNGYSFELKDKNLKVELSKDSALTAECALNGEKIEFTSLSGEAESIYKTAFENGFTKVK